MWCFLFRFLLVSFVFFSFMKMAIEREQKCSGVTPSTFFIFPRKFDYMKMCDPQSIVNTCCFDNEEISRR